MKVALVHDDLVQWGGAERVLLAISELFPQAPIFTSLFDKNNLFLNKNFGSKKIITSFLQKIPNWKYLYKTLVPLYPIAFEQFDFSKYDLVISNTTRFAKCIITKPQTKHICYCHTPPRFLWNYSGQHSTNLLLPFLSFLRVYDQVSAKRVDLWIAGSENAQLRIRKVYRVHSVVLYPPVDIDKFQTSDSFDGDYFLVISRLNYYKRVDLAVKVFNQSGDRLRIVGVGPELNKLKTLAKSNIEFLESVYEQKLLNLICGSKAVIITAEEDFGLISLEAQAAGKPVIAYGKGGVLETILENKTGIFFDDQTESSLLDAVNLFKTKQFNQDMCYENAKKFSKEKFQKKLFNIINNF